MRIPVIDLQVEQICDSRGKLPRIGDPKGSGHSELSYLGIFRSDWPRGLEIGLGDDISEPRIVEIDRCVSPITNNGCIDGRSGSLH